MNLNEAIALHLAELHKLGYVPQCKIQTQTQIQTLVRETPAPVPLPGVSLLFAFSVVMVVVLTRRPQRFSWWSNSD